MSIDKRFTILRRVLRVFGLSQEAVDDIVDRVVELVSSDDGRDGSKQSPEYPYLLRDQFLSAAELNFLEVLRPVLDGHAIVYAKVGLGELFWVKTDDYGRRTRFMNKIDRKHVDFLLCDTATMLPLLGIELDDRTHQRADRKERDAFVDNVFQAARLPLLHVLAKRSYASSELAGMLKPHMISGSGKLPTTAAPNSKPVPVVTTARPDAPRCAKCGGEMVLRTAKSGPKAGDQFWGCPNYPTCRSILPVEG